MPRKNSFWNTVSTNALIEVVKKSNSLMDVFRYFKLSRSGASYEILKNRLNKDNISVSHFHGNTSKNKEKRFIKNKTNSSVFTKNSKVLTKELKMRILKYNLFNYKCNKCPVVDMWNNKELVLHLDHKNGESTDNRLKNLQFLCPNCHSQTKTYSGRNKKTRKNPVFCIECGNKKRFKSKKGKCLSCYNKSKELNKFEVSKQKLERLIYKHPITHVGKIFGVTDNSIRKRCRRLGIKIPKFPVGHWLKK